MEVTTTKRGRLSTRSKLSIWEREGGRCYLCGHKIRANEGEGWVFEHVRALELGGADEPENIRLTCTPCATAKTKDDHSRAAKAKRQKARHLGLKESKSPLPYGRQSPFKRKLDGTIVRRDP